MNDITEFRAPTGMDLNSIASQGFGMVHYGPTDDKLIVGFYKKSIPNAAKSREMGVPFHESRDFVKIQHPGETLNVVDRPVLDDDKRRWPRQWDNYQRGVNQIPDGIPLSLLFPAAPHIVTMMRGYNIHTVEQLANLSGEAISTVGMGAQDWVNAAKRYMERADKGVNHHQHEKALADRDAKIAALERQVSEITALVRQQQSQSPAPLASHPYDAQTAQINNTHQSATDPFTQPAAQFVQDLSGQVQPQRRGPGRPRRSQEN
jgi:hypothetical protein